MVLTLVSAFESGHFLKLLVHLLLFSTGIDPVPAACWAHGAGHWASLPGVDASSVSALTGFQVSQGRKKLKIFRVTWEEEARQEHGAASPEKVS